MLKDESPLRSKKEDLLAMISKVDREIAQGESQIVKLKKKEAELEAAAKHGDEAEQDATKEADGISKHMAPLSLPQKIYLENREKAKEASACFSKFGSPVDMPLYNQPSDCDIYHKNQRIRTEFRPRLVLWLRNKTILRVALQKKICQDYATALEAWLKKVERLENSARKKAKDAKMREYFEKIFPELRKQREDRERFSRVGARVKSEADMETVLQNIQEEEHEAKKMKELAVIPPVLWSAERKRNRFVNLNGVVEDPKKVFEEFHAVNIWNNQEKEIFKEKYLTHGKNFGLIASYLERKSVSDCVHFYYLSKKEVKYKELLKKINKRKNNKIGKVAPPPLPEILSTGPGVATRGSVAALRNQQHPQNQQDSNASKTKTEEPEGRSATEGTEASQKGPAGEEAVPSPGKKGAKENQGPPSSKENGVPSSRGRRGEREQRAAAKNAAATAETDSSEEDDETGKGGPHSCVVCQAQCEHFGQSKSLEPSEAHVFGLKPEDVSPGSRVCKGCRNRRSAPVCPMRNCTKQRWRRKLRHLPPKWSQISAEEKKALVEELGIPDGVTKCCNTCYSRISSRIGGPADSSNSKEKETEKWTDEEIDLLKAAIRDSGLNWTRVANGALKKTPLQCKRFYSANKERHGLALIILEYKKRMSEAGIAPPYVTDEEESGSSTSSAEETGLPNGGSNIPASPPNGLNKTVSSNLAPKEKGGNGGAPNGFAPSSSPQPSSKEGDKGPGTPMTNGPVSPPKSEGEQSGGTTEYKFSMADMIHVTITKNLGEEANQRPRSSESPTLSSILKTKKESLKDVIEQTITANLANTPSNRPSAPSSPTLTSILRSSESTGGKVSPPVSRPASTPSNVSGLTASPLPSQEKLLGSILPPRSKSPPPTGPLSSVGPPKAPSPAVDADGRKRTPASSPAPAQGGQPEGLAAVQLNSILARQQLVSSSSSPNTTISGPSNLSSASAPSSSAPPSAPVDDSANEVQDLSIKKKPRSSPSPPPVQRDASILRRPFCPPTVAATHKDFPPPAHSNKQSTKPPIDYPPPPVSHFTPRNNWGPQYPGEPPAPTPKHPPAPYLPGKPMAKPGGPYVTGPPPATQPPYPPSRGGSITQGTPLHGPTIPSHFDRPPSREVNQPGSSVGSITQGTPRGGPQGPTPSHLPPPAPSPSRRSSIPTSSPSHLPPPPSQGHYYSASSRGPYPPSAPPPEDGRMIAPPPSAADPVRRPTSVSSRQTILNDYVTAQNVRGGGGGRGEKESPPISTPPSATGPPPGSDRYPPHPQMYMSASEAAARGVSSRAGVIRGGSGVPPSHAPSPPQSAAAAHAHAYRVELERNNNPLAHFADLAVAKAEEDRDRRGSVEMYMDKRKMAVQQQQQQESHRSVAQLPSPTASMHRGHPAHPQALVAQHNSQSPYLSGLPPGSVFRDQPSPRGEKYAPQPPSAFYNNLDSKFYAAMSHKGPPTSVSSPYMNIPAVKYGTVPAPEKYKGPSPNSAVLDRREAYPRGVESVEIRKIPSGYGPPHGPPHPSEAYPRSSSAERPPSRGGKPSSRGPPDDGRQGLTAANLIDHIITRSMNQEAPSPHESMRGPPHSGLHHLPPPTSRPSPVPLMQPGVMTSHPHHGITQQQMAQMIAAEQHHRDRDRAIALTMAQAQQQHREQQQRESNERERERAAHEAAAERHRQEIMSRYHRKPYDHGPPSSGGPHGSVQADERQIIRIAQGGGPPPPGPHHGSIAPPSSPRVSLSRSSPIVSHGGGPDAMSPPCQGRPPSGANPLVSYVTNKIAEAMRTDRTDDKGPGDSHHQRPPSNDSHHHRKEEHQPPTSAPLPPHKRRTPPYGYEHHPLPVSSAGPPIRHPYPMYPTYPPGRHPGLPPIPTSNAHHPPMPPHSHAPPLPPTSQAYKAQYEPLSDSD